jgi:chloramphenicol 3-O-phosphotransferase
MLHAHPAYFVCIDISLAGAEAREVERGDRGPGNVRYFYDRVYGLNDVYDLRVDAEENDPEACARMIKEAVATTEALAIGRLYRQLS